MFLKVFREFQCNFRGVSYFSGSMITVIAQPSTKLSCLMVMVKMQSRSAFNFRYTANITMSSKQCGCNLLWSYSPRYSPGYMKASFIVISLTLGTQSIWMSQTRLMYSLVFTSITFRKATPSAVSANILTQVELVYGFLDATFRAYFSLHYFSLLLRLARHP